MPVAELFAGFELGETDRKLEAFPEIGVGQFKGSPDFFISSDAADDLQRSFSSHFPEAKEEEWYSEEVISMEVRDPQGLELFRVQAVAKKGVGDCKSTVKKMEVRICLQKE